MQLCEAVDNCPLTAKGHHLEDCRLREVVAILSAPLTLCYPDVVMLLGNDKVHILRHTLAGTQHLRGLQRTLHGEGLVDTSQCAHPVQLQQIVTNSYLTGCAKANVDEQLVKESGVKDYVPVVADKSVAVVNVNLITVDVDARALCLNKMLRIG